MLRRLVRSALPQFLRTARLCYGQEGEDMILARIFKDRAAGFFVDVGAHHPTRFSNTYLLYRRGWRGVNIDANPGSMELFRKLRPRDINLELGIARAAGGMTYFDFVEPAFNTFDAAQAARVQQNSGVRLLREVTVPVEPLATVLERHVPEGRAIDLLTVDVEGLDYEVLASNDWDRFRPDFVLAEVIRSLPGTPAPDRVLEFMTGAGYEVYARTVNTCFFRNSAAGP